MELWKRNLWILWLGVLLTTSSYTMSVPFLPLYLIDLGMTSHVDLWSGVIFSVTFLVGAVMAPIWGARADKYGKKRMVLRAGFSLVAVYALGAVVQSPEQLFVQRILHGLVSGFVPASMAIVASNTPEKHIGWGLGIMQTAGAVGGIIGPLVGGSLAEWFGMRASFVIASGAVLAATLLVLALVREERVEASQEQGGFRESLRIAWGNRSLMQMLLIILIVQNAAMILQPLLTLHIARMQGQFEGSVLSSGIVFAIAGVAVILATPIWAKLGEKYGYSRTLLVALAGAAVLNALQVYAHNLYAFSAMRFGLGLFLSGVLPAINKIITDRTHADFRGRAFGLTTSATQLGSMIGPLIGGLLGGLLGIEYVFVLTGVLLLLTSVLVWNSRRRENVVQLKYHESLRNEGKSL